MCPKCEKEGKRPLFPQLKMGKTYFNNYRIFLEVLTEIALFLENEIFKIFSEFEVIK